MSLPVKCSHADLKCEWEGTVETLKEHLVSCEAALIPCPNKCTLNNQPVSVKLGLLQDHVTKMCALRPHECVHCKEKGTHTFITKVHDVACPMKVIRCPNAECVVTLERRMMVKHMSECRFSVITCKYKGIGCTASMQRGGMLAHESDDNLHLHMALDALLVLAKAKDFFVKVSILAVAVLAALVLCFQAWNVTVVKDVTVTVVGWTVIVIILAAVGLSCVLAAKYGPRLYHMHRDRSAYSVVPFFLKECYPFDKSQVFLSTPFLSSPYGYRMAVRVDTNGNGTAQGTHMSVFVRMLEGDYDSMLRWPFTGKVTVTLLNQLEDKNHFQFSILVLDRNNCRVGGVDAGTPNFFPLSNLRLNPGKNTQYLKDDTLYFRVMVSDVPGNKPWLETNVRQQLGVYKCTSL